MCTPQIYDSMRSMMGSPSLQQVAPGIPMPGMGGGDASGGAGHGMPQQAPPGQPMSPHLPTAAASEAAARARPRTAAAPARPPMGMGMAPAGTASMPGSTAAPPPSSFAPPSAGAPTVYLPGVTPSMVFPSPYQEPPSRGFPDQQAQQQLRARPRPTMGDM